jgi:hypothetical protein
LGFSDFLITDILIIIINTDVMILSIIIVINLAEINPPPPEGEYLSPPFGLYVPRASLQPLRVEYPASLVKFDHLNFLSCTLFLILIPHIKTIFISYS